MIAGYIHFIPYKAGIYLCGGLCVDSNAYRELSASERREVAQEGSLSRWLSVRAIAALEHKAAVFAFTGDARSRRDAVAIGFELAVEPNLYVQWHALPAPLRRAMVEEVNGLGPF